jgi:hypothetical protein
MLWETLVTMVVEEVEAPILTPEQVRQLHKVV